ncbi:hypothetical protein [Phyllobacterium chamaecytisi]|uniref:hypothetical protein n=1 Tax=Phyllobacterium chamaecytisi TaxID=2876082 RepID=UPI001CCFC02B|nr:hypothetical protein [Phyllobacterium sp. KW56]MBZ9603101.1 hypothetical protein [Phyllobacterium sp. KW56]
MDLSNASQLELTISSIFNEEASKVSAGLGPIARDAAQPLIAPGRTWPNDELRNVDVEMLRKAIRSVVEELQSPSRPSQSVNSFTVQEALLKSTCHYLWFC